MSGSEIIGFRIQSTHRKALKAVKGKGETEGEFIREAVRKEVLARGGKWEEYAYKHGDIERITPPSD